MALIQYSSSQAKRLAEKKSNELTKVKYNHLQIHKGRVSARNVGFSQKIF